MFLNLEVVGPVEIPHAKSANGSVKLIGKGHVKEFLKKMDSKKMARKQGCYIFSVGVGGEFTPWYVGKTVNSIKAECFTDANLIKYNKVLFKAGKGKPCMFFVVAPARINKIPTKIISEVEKYLIHAAYAKNPNLSNIRKTMIRPKWGIKGVVRGDEGRATKTSILFLKMMGI